MNQSQANRTLRILSQTQGNQDKRLPFQEGNFNQIGINNVNSRLVYSSSSDYKSQMQQKQNIANQGSTIGMKNQGNSYFSNNSENTQGLQGQNSASTQLGIFSQHDMTHNEGYSRIFKQCILGDNNFNNKQNPQTQAKSSEKMGQMRQETQKTKVVLQEKKSKIDQLAEVERRFNRSSVNKMFIFPRKRQSKQDISLDSSIDSMNNVTIYNLYSQNNQEQQKKEIKSNKNNKFIFENQSSQIGDLALTKQVSHFKDQLFTKTEEDETCSSQHKKEFVSSTMGCQQTQNLPLKNDNFSSLLQKNQGQFIFEGAQQIQQKLKSNSAQNGVQYKKNIEEQKLGEIQMNQSFEFKQISQIGAFNSISVVKQQDQRLLHQDKFVPRRSKTKWESSAQSNKETIEKREKDKYINSQVFTLSTEMSPEKRGFSIETKSSNANNKQICIQNNFSSLVPRDTKEGGKNRLKDKNLSQGTIATKFDLSSLNSSSSMGRSQGNQIKNNLKIFSVKSDYLQKVHKISQNASLNYVNNSQNAPLMIDQQTAPYIRIKSEGIENTNNILGYLGKTQTELLRKLKSNSTQDTNLQGLNQNQHSFLNSICVSGTKAQYMAQKNSSQKPHPIKPIHLLLNSNTTAYNNTNGQNNYGTLITNNSHNSVHISNQITNPKQKLKSEYDLTQRMSTLQSQEVSDNLFSDYNYQKSGVQKRGGGGQGGERISLRLNTENSIRPKKKVPFIHEF